VSKWREVKVKQGDLVAPESDERQQRLNTYMKSNGMGQNSTMQRCLKHVIIKKQQQFLGQ